KGIGNDFTWGPKDCFFVPSWHWHQFKNMSKKEPAIIFSVTDRPVLESLGLFREEQVRKKSMSDGVMAIKTKPNSDSLVCGERKNQSKEGSDHGTSVSSHFGRWTHRSQPRCLEKPS